MKRVIEDFDSEKIALSGQCFRWKKLDYGKFVVPAFGKVLVINRENDYSHEVNLSCDMKDWINTWKPYFDLDTDYSRIGELIESSNDEHLKNAYLVGKGIRILRQDLWEVIFSFMVSQNNNITRISNSIEQFCEKVNAGFVEVEGKKYYAFPSVEKIDPAIFDDKSLGFGYRAPYLKELCEYVSDNPDYLDRLKEADYETAYNMLTERKGIGAKVANCICLFGLHHTDSFPKDTHINSILDNYYPDGFDFERYEGVSGIIQQYLFFYDLYYDNK